MVQLEFVGLTYLRSYKVITYNLTKKIKN